MRWLTSAIALLTAVSQLPAQGAQPKGPPPVVMSMVHNNGQPMLAQTTTEYRTVVREVMVDVGGGVVEVRKVAETVAVPVQKMIVLDAKGLQAYDHAGNRIDPKNLNFKELTPVLVSANGQPVDPYYLRLVREGTVVLVVPGLATGGGTGGVPKPLPKPPVPK